jgi:hypothetical protein
MVYFSVLVFCTKKNLATLLEMPIGKYNDPEVGFEKHFLL